MRRILIVAPTFYPDPVVASVRVGQWARHLPEFGWQPLVLCRHRGYTATPQELAERFHPELRLEYLGPQVATPKPTGANARRSAKQRVRDALKHMLAIVAVPDELVWTWRSLAGQATAIAREFQPDVVLSSSTPHSIHCAGRRLAAATGAAWVADYRDPYLIDCRHQPRGLQRLSAWRHQRFEDNLYRDAALSIHAIPVHARWASRRYPFARDRVRILTNGIPSELLDESLVPSQKPASRLRIAAVGVLGQGAVNAMTLVLRHLAGRGVDAEFRHVGHARDSADAVPADLRDRLLLRGPVSHREALAEIASADVLLKYDDQVRAQVIGLSSKLFEYLATGRPIVAVNPTRPDWQLIGRLPWCACVSDGDPAAIVAAVERAATSGARPDERWLAAFRQQYNRRNQTGQLARWLEDLLPSRPRG